MYLGIISLNSANINATKSNQFWYLSMVENPVLSGTIRMEGMQEFCVQTTVMDGQGNSHK